MPKPQKIKDAAPAYSMKRGVWALDDIKEYPGNARTHPPEQIDLLGKLIEKYGQDQDIVVDEDGVILKGHGRKTAMKAIGWKKAEVTQRFGLSDADKRAMRINDNVVALLSGWDQSLLAFEAKTLQSQGFNMQLLGFARSELLQLTDSNPGATDPEAVPEPPKVPVSKFGDVWTLGRHRLCCGDSTSKADVDRLLNGVIPDLANCDPPYGIKIVKGSGSSVGGAKPFGSMKPLGRVHAPGQDGFRKLGREHGPAKRAIIAPGLYEPIVGDDSTDTAIAAYKMLVDIKVPIVVLWGGNYYANELPPSRCWLVWDKETSGSFADAELAWTNQDRVTKLLRHQWNGLMKDSERGQRRVHPTQKPIALAEWVIETMAPKCRTVLDLFVGSGSALMAAHNKDRQFFGMEMAQAYVDASILRWQMATGQHATLDGKTYDEVKKERERAKGDRGKSVRRKGTVATERDQTPAQHPVREEVRQGRGDARRGANRKPPAADATGNPPGS